VRVDVHSARHDVAHPARQRTRCEHALLVERAVVRQSASNRRLSIRPLSSSAAALQSSPSSTDGVPMSVHRPCRRERLHGSRTCGLQRRPEHRSSGEYQMNSSGTGPTRRQPQPP
jgi:hypothetical protein